MAIVWTEAQLAALKTDEDFRLRGGDFTRLESLTDGAFALALTFLVIVQQEVPRSFAELLDAFRQIPAFAASFAVLILIWRAHVRWSRRYGLEDGRAIALSSALVFTVLVFVYPLKIVFSAFLADLSSGWFPSRVRFESFDELRQLFVAYGLGFAALELCLLGLYGDALRRAEALRLNALERFDTRASLGAHALIFGVALASLTLALLLPSRLSPLSGYSYAALILLSPLYRRRVRHRRAAFAAAPGH